MPALIFHFALLCYISLLIKLNVLLLIPIINPINFSIFIPYITFSYTPVILINYIVHNLTRFIEVNFYSVFQTIFNMHIIPQVRFAIK